MIRITKVTEVPDIHGDTRKGGWGWGNEIEAGIWHGYEQHEDAALMYHLGQNPFDYKNNCKNGGGVGI